jgi:glutaredoxin
MNHQLTLYSRRDCCLCEEMKAVIRQVASRILLQVEEIDVDTLPELQELYGKEVPVLFINHRKAFKYRVTAQELEKKLR